MKIHKKLQWIEYTYAGPLGLTPPFEAVGFETKRDIWDPRYPDGLTNILLPRVEAWQPDIIVFWMPHVHFISEPAEWISACQVIRNHPQLRRAKIMAFFGVEEITEDQEKVWRNRYDFYTRWPLRLIEHAKLAKHLLGEEVKGYEGVIYYLSHNGNWKVQDYLDDESLEKNELRPDAAGQFTQAPETRLLKSNSQGGYAWSKDRIQAKIPTDIVFVIKDLQAWQKGLSALEIERLESLSKTTSSRQLLIGINDVLLQAGPELVGQVLAQAEQAGGWHVFVNEHLWVEGVVPSIAFSAIVYEKSKPKPPGRSIVWYGPDL